MFKYKREVIRDFLIILLCISVILYIGRVLFIPLSFSILISFLLYPICKWLESYRVSKLIAVLISITLLLVSLFAVIFIMSKQVSAFANDWNALRERFPDALIQIKALLSGYLGISSETQKKFYDYLVSTSTSRLFNFIPELIYSSGILLVAFILIPFLSVLILLSRTQLIKALCSFFPQESVKEIHTILRLVVKAYYDFIKGMIIVYIIVGILNSVGLLLLGIPHPFLFGCTASVLTFVPFIGIIAGSLLPVSVAWITFNSVWYPLGVVAVFSLVQYFEANLIFPLAVSSKLKISSLATIISIIAGGILWGAAGMILFVPFVAILKLVADHFHFDSLSSFLGRN